jgi:adenine-specific DNA-methyltransferase
MDLRTQIELPVDVCRPLLLEGDCRDWLPRIADESVDAVVIDPPYGFFRKTDIAWDHQWKTTDEFISWFGGILADLRRVLKPNGSIYVFASPYMVTRVEVEMARHFRVLNHIVWRKDSGRHRKQRKEALRKFFPQTERLIFAERYDAPKLPKPLRAAPVELDAAASAAWLQKEMKRSGSGLPRRYFHVTAKVPYTDVWEFEPVQRYPGKHPCEKPQAMLRSILDASTRPGDLVLDCFMGGGSMGHACTDMGRRFVGIEMDAGNFRMARQRIERARAEPDQVDRIAFTTSPR